MGVVEAAMLLDRPAFRDLKPLASEWEQEGLFDLVEPKMDGQWGQLVIKSGVAQVWSRHGQLKHEQHVSSDLPDLVMHGEFLYGSNWALRRGMEGQFHAFDLVVRDGRSIADLTLKQRRQRLERLLDSHRDRLPSWLVLLPQDPVGTWRRHWDVLVEGLGYEGLVFKSSEGKFGAPWARMKRVLTMDYVCMGANPGGGRYAGTAASSLIGGLWKNGAPVAVANVGGMDDGLRREVWEHPDRFIGRVFEAHGRGLFDGGGLRHPAFLRWRDDKTPEQCVMPDVVR